MAEHKIRKNGIIYIIPDDELFQKWRRGEAFIDDYGHLVDSRSHRVMKPLRCYAEEPAEETIRVVPQSPNDSIGSRLKEQARISTQEKLTEFVAVSVDRALDKLLYEIGPGIWREHVVPLWQDAKYVLTTKELKADKLRQARKDRNEIVPVETEYSEPIDMTPDEIDKEKRKAVYHWIAMLDSLRKLQRAEAIDTETTLEQLTKPVMLEKINSYLDVNPKLLEMDEYLTLRELLGRDLYEEKQFVPIQAKEIEIIAAACEQGEAAKKAED